MQTYLRGMVKHERYLTLHIIVLVWTKFIILADNDLVDQFPSVNSYPTGTRQP